MEGNTKMEGLRACGAPPSPTHFFNVLCCPFGFCHFSLTFSQYFNLHSEDKNGSFIILRGENELMSH